MGADNLKPLSKADQERCWLEDNREAIEAYNRRVAQDGLLSDHTGFHDDPARPSR